MVPLESGVGYESNLVMLSVATTDRVHLESRGRPRIGQEKLTSAPKIVDEF